MTAARRPPAGRPSEDALLEWLRRSISARRESPSIGDDTAKLRLRGDFAFTVDTQEEGHHVPPGLDAAVLARRLLAVNLSDLAASGAQPELAFLALAAPARFAHHRFFRALDRAARACGMSLAGGDLAASDHVRAALFLVGRRPARGRWLGRANARPGDALWVGGTLGESAAGRLCLAARRPGPTSRAARAAIGRHLEPRAQLDLGRWLGRQRRAAAIDVSDGLALDLHRLCRRSGVGARLDAEDLPATAGFAALCDTLAVRPLELQLGGGEDYVLLFALPRSIEPPPRFGCVRVGSITARRTVRLVEGGKSRPLAAAGWDHLRTNGAR